jgi:hypothetical protein
MNVNCPKKLDTIWGSLMERSFLFFNLLCMTAKFEKNQLIKNNTKF